METLSPPLRLHRCQGLEDGAALGGAACGIASVFARHPHRSCSAADLKRMILGHRNSALVEALEGELRPKSVPTSASHPLTLKRSPSAMETRSNECFHEPSRSRQRTSAEHSVRLALISGLAERYECLVKILFGLESRSKLKGFAEIDSLTHADAMPKLRFYLSGNHIGIITFAL